MVEQISGHPVLWRPQPKQSAALSCPAQELFFGGAAGGGKSDFLLNDYLQGAAKYGNHWKGVLFRRTYPELEQLKIRAFELYLPIGAKYKQNDKEYGTNVFIFPNGAILQLRYIAADQDVTHYQGHEYTWIAFDEIGNYPTDYCWTYMWSRLRNPYGIPGYMRATGNPGGVGQAWIKARWINKHEPMKIFWMERKIHDETGEHVMKISACFIPSRLEDNPALIGKDHGYEAGLSMLGPILYRALRFGDWDVCAGQVFSEFTREKHVIQPFSMEAGTWYKFCALDWGYSKPYSLGWYAVNGDGRMVKYREWYGCAKDEQGEDVPDTGVKEGSLKLAKRAWEQSLTEGVDTIIVDPAIFGKDNDHPSQAEDFISAGWKVIPANNDRKNGLVMFHQMLQTTDQNGVPMLTFYPTCYGLIRTLPLLLPNPNNAEDVNTKMEDHAYDETRYAIMSEIAKTPHRQIQKMNGSWQRTQLARAEDWDPFEN